MTRPMAKMTLFALLVLSALAGACTPNLYAVSTPPPLRTAELRSEQPLFSKRTYQVRLSAGVAMAFNCSHGGPCRDARVTSEDPAVARVVPAHLNRLERDYMSLDHNAPTTFVLMGVSPGETRVHLASADGDASIRVTVIP